MRNAITNNNSALRENRKISIIPKPQIFTPSPPSSPPPPSKFTFSPKSPKKTFGRRLQSLNDHYTNNNYKLRGSKNIESNYSSKPDTRLI